MSPSSTRQIAYAGLFTALIALGAFVAVPIGPVPFTLQVMFVLLAGMLLGPRLASLSVAAYLVLGLAAPVFAGGASGVGALIGPTAGYLWGFLPAVWLTGTIASRGQASLTRLAAAGLVGLIPIYSLGAVWLAYEQHLSAGTVIVAGIMQFVPLDLLKAIMAAVVAKSLVSLPLGLPVPQKGR